MDETKVEVDVSSIEAELGNIWQNLAHEEDRTRDAMMRTSVVNLIIFDDSDWDSQKREAVIGEIASEHPSRIMLISPLVDREESLDIRVAARCNPLASGRSHICCEIIHFSASHLSFDKVLSLVRSLLVPDLPTVSWWRPAPDPDSGFFRSLIAMADRAIIDSEPMDPGSPQFQSLYRLIDELKEGTGFSDLAWSRITPWRTAIAGFFDVPAWTRHLDQIHQIEIFYQRSRQGPELTVRALYLFSWLASHLEWEIEGPFERAKPRNYTLKSHQRSGEVKAILKTENSMPEEAAIIGTRLLTRNIAAGIFEVWRSEDHRYLQSRVSFDEQDSVSRISHKYQQKESAMVSRELEIIGHDLVFEKALRFAAHCMA